MEASKLNIVLTNFNGLPEKYAPFRVEIINASDSLGILHMCVKEPELKSLKGAAAKVKDLTHVNPGAMPTNTALFPMWKMQMENYKAQTNGESQIKNAIIRHVDTATKQLLCNYKTGVTSISLSDMLHILDTEFQFSSQSEVLYYESLMSKDCVNSSDIRGIIADHKQAHACLAAMEQPVAPITKVMNLQRAVKKCGLFSRVIEDFTNDFPDVKKQLFETLAERLKVRANNLPSDIQTVPADYAMSMAEWTQTAACEAAYKASFNAPRTGGNVWKDAVKKQYCWSCGHTCNHSSKTCWDKHRKEGHNEEATFKNQMGGESGQYKPKGRFNRK